ncbi:MAG: membrane protein insertase YidC [Luminiphilus sp.]|jgi:YidC/Oxa1 family membrane protein insertase|nr:membrane protein insertase YidC [Luminiphilus sp.]
MDIPRLALIAASVLLGLMLLGEWTRFSGDQHAASEPVAMVEASAPDVDYQPPVILDSGVTRAGRGAGDLPASEDIAPAPSDLSLSTTAPALDNVISVKTDVLHLMIDLQGGDVVGAALRDHPKTLEDLADPFVLLEKNANRTYIAQSGLVGRDGIDRAERARYTSARSVYEASGTAPLEVALKYVGDRPLEVRKIFTFEPGSHVVTVRHDIQNISSSAAQITPFAQLKRDSSPAPSASDSGMGMRPFLGSALTHPEQRFEKFDFEDMADTPFKADLEGGWIAMLQHYFVSAWVPDPSGIYRYRTRHTDRGFNIIGYTGPALSLAPNERITVTSQLYIGPKNQRVLADLSSHLDLVVDYGWLWWIAQPLFWLLTTIQSVVINWGVAIIILTLIVKLAFFKLSAAGYKSMARMRKVQPRILAIREDYANDKAKQSQAMMELYKKEQINPLGGCLPILVQMPVFIALYWVLMESVELRQAPLALWIKDLSVMDPYFVMPILMGASMYYMQKLNPPPPDPMQAKIMQWMPIVFTFFFLWFPAGLVLYWVCNNLLSMAQQYIINRRIESGAL